MRCPDYEGIETKKDEATEVTSSASNQMLQLQGIEINYGLSLIVCGPNRRSSKRPWSLVQLTRQPRLLMRK